MATVIGLTADATVDLIEAAKARANHTGTQPASTISDLTEATQDMIAAFLIAGTNITLNYNDVSNTLTVASTASGINEGIALSAYTNGAGSAAANTTAIQNAINAAAAADMPLINDLGAITVQINARINLCFDGFRARFNGLKLNQTTANTGGVRIGGVSQDIDGLSVYCSTNPASGATGANAFEFTNCAFSRFSNFVAENACRGFYMPQSAPTIGDAGSNTVFSCLFDNMRINGWSLSAINFQTWVAGSAASTGNVWNNTYLHNNFFGSPAASAAEAIIFRAFDDTVFNQLNIEWGTYTTSMTFFQECRNMLFNSVHLEGNSLSGSSLAFLRAYFATRLVFVAITLQNNTIANVSGQRSLFKAYGSGGATTSIEATSVNIGDTVNAGARPFALIEIESGSTDGDYEFRKIDLSDFSGSVVVDATGVSPSQVKSYNDVELRPLTVPALTSTANIMAPNMPVDLVRTSDASSIVSSTTLVTDAVLQFTAGVGRYLIEGVLIYDCDEAADVKYRFNFAGTGTGTFSSPSINTVANVTPAQITNHAANLINTNYVAGGVDATQVAMHFRGILNVTVAGLFSIQYAQNTSNATGLIVKTFSHLSYRKTS